MSPCSQSSSPVVVVNCANPVLTIGFPPACPGGNNVVLANGAVVDLNLLGEILSTHCPSLVCPTTVVVPGTNIGF